MGVNLNAVAMAMPFVLVFVHVDMVRRKRLIQRKEEFKNKVLDLIDKVMECDSEDEVYTIVLDSAKSFVSNAHAASLMLLEDNHFYFRKTLGFTEQTSDFRIAKEDTYLYKINNLKQAQIIKFPIWKKSFDNFMQAHKINQPSKGKRLYYTICSPIYVNGKLKGLLNVDSASIFKNLSKFDLKLVNHMALELSIALKNFENKETLKFLVENDELTKIFNRRGFERRFERELTRIKRYRSSCTLALLDLDNFKQINDRYGHAVGDEALIFISSILKSNIRTSDILARFSGDEFVVAFVGLTEIEAKEKLEGIRMMVTERSFGEIALGFSYGMCQVQNFEDNDMDHIVSIADRNMYEDKKLKEFRMGI